MSQQESECAAADHEPHRHVLRSDAEIRRAARMGAALGEPGRLRILALLLDGAHCVSELTAETGDSISLVSQRLKVLTAADLLSRRRQGKHVYYDLVDDHVRRLVEALLSHAGEGHSSSTGEYVRSQV